VDSLFIIPMINEILGSKDSDNIRETINFVSNMIGLENILSLFDGDGDGNGDGDGYGNGYGDSNGKLIYFGK